MSGGQGRAALYVIDQRDNVATAVEDLPRGRASFAGAQTGEVTVLEAVPFGHKVALTSISCGAPIVKHGYVIARATREIPEGAWVGIHNIESRFDSAAGEKQSDPKRAEKRYQLPRYCKA